MPSGKNYVRNYQGGSNTRSNRLVISRHSNDSYPRTASGAIAQMGAFKKRKKRNA